MTRKVLSAIAANMLLVGWISPAAGNPISVQAAKKYHTEQIKSDDVVLQERESQALLQTDLMHRLLTDKKFLRAAWARNLVRDAFSGADLERVRHEINEPPTSGPWKAELDRVFLEVDGVPWQCSPCRS